MAQTVQIKARDQYRNIATAYTSDKSITFSGASDATTGQHPNVLDKNSTSVLDDLDAKRGALGKAIELMPQFAAAY